MGRSKRDGAAESALAKMAGPVRIPSRAFWLAYLACVLSINAGDQGEDSLSRNGYDFSGDFANLGLDEIIPDVRSSRLPEHHSRMHRSTEHIQGNEEQVDEARLMEGNSDEDLLLKHSERGHKLQAKASVWSDKAHAHENKARELEGKAGLQKSDSADDSDAPADASAGKHTSNKEKALEKKLAREEQLLGKMKSKMSDDKKKKNAAMNKVKKMEKKMRDKIAATKKNFKKKAAEAKKQGSKTAAKAEKKLKKKLSKEEKEMAKLKEKMGKLKKGSKEHKEAEAKMKKLKEKLEDKLKRTENDSKKVLKDEKKLEKKLSKEEKQMAKLKEKMGKYKK